MRKRKIFCAALCLSLATGSMTVSAQIPDSISSLGIQMVTDIVNYKPPTPGESMNQSVDFSGNWLDNTVNFWNAYGNDIGNGVGHLSTNWDVMVDVNNLQNSYADGVKWGGGIIKGAGYVTNTMDSLSAVHQLTHPQDNPYASHPSLSFAYDVITITQAAYSWLEGKPAQIATAALGTTKNTWDDEATRTAFLDWADNNVYIQTLDMTMNNVNDFYTEAFGGGRRSEWSLEDWREKDYFDKLNFYAQMVKEGREKEYEWLRDQLLERNPYTGVSVLPNNQTAKKPNIYLYPTEETEISVNFTKPQYLTKTIPEYGDGWTVTAEPDGTLLTPEGAYGYLFYESLAKKQVFQTEEGFLLKADSREEDMREILECYGFNKQETDDFIDYWDGYLKENRDYLMCPISTEAVNGAMPVTFSIQPDSLTRIWFAFVPYAGGEYKKPQVMPIVRDGFTVVEWGGTIIK